MTWGAWPKCWRLFASLLLLMLALCSYYASVEESEIITQVRRYGSSFTSLGTHQPFSTLAPNVTFTALMPVLTPITISNSTYTHIPILQSDDPREESNVTVGLRPTDAPPRRTIRIHHQATPHKIINPIPKTEQKLAQPTSKAFIPDRKSIPSTHSHTEVEKKLKAVIIITAKRSGSSFLGELFNHHPDVFYIYEPLWALDEAARKSSSLNASFLQTALTILNGTLHCDFHTGYPKSAIARNTKFCGHNRKLLTMQQCGKFRRGQLQSWERTCTKYKLVVAKVIRIHDIENLKFLLTNSHVDWRIIHLVRDPRPTERSRQRTRPNNNLIRRTGTDKYDEVDLCRTLERNLKFWTDTPSWLQGKYKMVRYEDVAASPLEKTEELLTFAGLKMDESVVNWIKMNTEVQQNTGAIGQFGTSRNSSLVLDIWRKDMNWFFVKKIQSVCYTPMKYLGYALFPDSTTFRNTSIPSTLTLDTL